LLKDLPKWAGCGRHFDNPEAFLDFNVTPQNARKAIHGIAVHPLLTNQVVEDLQDMRIVWVDIPETPKNDIEVHVC
jgi:hypothetical protein